MNVLHISSAKSWRGGERQVAYLMEGLALTGHQSFLLSPEKSALSQKVSTLSKRTFVFRSGAFGLLRNLVTLKKTCESHNIDIVHAHDSHGHTLIWLAYRLGLLTAKSVVTRRLDNPIKNKSNGKYNYHKIERIICVSDAVRRTMEPQINDESRLVTIHSGIDISDGNDARLLSADRSINIGYVAAFTKEKDHRFFIACALELLKRNDRCKFILAGDGPLRSSIEQSVKEQKDHFQFTGFVDDVGAVYDRLDILLHTAESEALGTAILDGMKFGLPIVASDIGGVGEIVVHDENGRLVREKNVIQVVDSVLSIVGDSHVYNDMSMASLRLVKRFDKVVMVRKTEALYKDLIS